MQTNPWISIWTCPRKTISEIVAENPKRDFWVLAFIYGFVALLNLFQSLEIGNSIQFFAILLLSVIFAVPWGWLVFTVWSWVILWIGKLLKGQGSFHQMRAAFAWSCVPLLANALLWIVLILGFGNSLFQNFSESQQIRTGHAVFLFCVLIAKVAFTIWSLIIYINALAVVQKFSIARSIFNIVFSWFAIGIFFGLIWLGTVKK